MVDVNETADMLIEDLGTATVETKQRTPGFLYWDSVYGHGSYPGFEG